jgi:hypothetical protein
MTILNFLSQYILVYTRTGIYMSGTVYDGLSRHMTVYRISGKVHASIDWYILIHTCTSVYIPFLLFCPLLHPAGPPESCGPTSAKRHPFQATTSLFFHAFLWLLLAVAQTAGEGAASLPPPPPQASLLPPPPCCGRELDGDVVGGNKFAFESHTRAPSILRMPSKSKGAVMNL